MEKKENKGFTLMEMLLVVAIIAALAAVTIPSFSTALAAQREKSCEANRSALAAAVTLAFVSGKDSVRDNNDGTMWVAPALLAQYACPGGGTYTVSWDAEMLRATVRCSEHGGEGIKIVQTTQDATEALNAIAGVFQSYAVSAKSGIDSTAADKPGSTAYSVMQTEAGQTLRDKAAALHAVSWRYDYTSATKAFFFWSTLDITTLTPGDKLPVLRYNYDSGTYTVWITNIVARTNGWNGTDYTYNAIAPPSTGYKPSTGNTSKDNQTYEAALIHYQNAMKEYHLA